MHSVIWYAHEIPLFQLILLYVGDVLILLPQVPYWHEVEMLINFGKPYSELSSAVQPQWDYMDIP